MSNTANSAGGAQPPLPRFFRRVADAVRPIADLDVEQLGAIVGSVRVGVVLSSRAGADFALREQARLACNLLARLYPRLHLIGPPELIASLQASILAIHPHADVQLSRLLPADADGILMLQPDPDDNDTRDRAASVVRVTTSGWNVAIDRHLAAQERPFALAALAGACLGVAEVFRYVFAAHLGDRGRTQLTPAELNLITCGSGEAGLPDAPPGLDMTGTCLVGAGAIGQAFLLALRTIDPVGPLTVVDHEPVRLANLQRYVLTDDTSVDRAKTEIAADYFAGTGLTVEQVPTRWGADPRSALHWQTVVVALDSAADRIGVAAGLHRKVYNAWTQPEDLGWSRHEAFGTEPCLSCLYWPDRPRPSDHELIGQALGQHPLRMLLYLGHRVPIGAPLPPPQNGVLPLPQAPGLEPPPDLPRWFQVPLAADLVATGMLRPDELESWAHRLLGDVYRDGVCAGGLVAVGPPEAAREALVPFAHQSALAGVMLAVQLLIASHPPLRERRPAQIEGRVDLLRPLPQTLTRPRQRTPGCLCADADFNAVWKERTAAQ